MESEDEDTIEFEIEVVESSSSSSLTSNYNQEKQLQQQQQQHSEETPNEFSIISGSCNINNKNQNNNNNDKELLSLETNNSEQKEEEEEEGKISIENEGASDKIENEEKLNEIQEVESNNYDKNENTTINNNEICDNSTTTLTIDNEVPILHQEKPIENNNNNNNNDDDLNLIVVEKNNNYSENNLIKLNDDNQINIIDNSSLKQDDNIIPIGEKIEEKLNDDEQTLTTTTLDIEQQNGNFSSSNNNNSSLEIILLDEDKKTNEIENELLSPQIIETEKIVVCGEPIRLIDVKLIKENFLLNLNNIDSNELVKKNEFLLTKKLTFDDNKNKINEEKKLEIEIIEEVDDNVDREIIDKPEVAVVEKNNLLSTNIINDNNNNNNNEFQQQQQQNFNSNKGRRRPSVIDIDLAKTKDDDLEWEFDNEPPFEERQVIVKRNKNFNLEYKLGDELGRGRFGTVFKCFDLNNNNRKLAAKFIHMRRKEDREDVEREVKIMSLLQHRRLLQLYDAFDDLIKNEMCLITELVEGGELFERIVDNDFELTEKKAAIFMRQICEGVSYMHKKSIVHLDMKPENILCLSKTCNRIKLIDFGLARELDLNQELRVMFGTPDFAAPEVLSYDLIRLETDMWSVGVICYVLLSGLSPFMGDNDLETMANVLRATYDFNDEAFDPISDLAKDFISKLLIKDPLNRLKPDECLKHSWLKRGGYELEISARNSRRQSMMPTTNQSPLIVNISDNNNNLQSVVGLTQEQLIKLEALAIGEDKYYNDGGFNYNNDNNSPLINVSLDKRNLKKYVVRRKWHKTVHAIMALGRMGANLKSQFSTTIAKTTNSDNNNE